MDASEPSNASGAPDHETRISFGETLSIAARTDVGHHRDNNEDSFGYTWHEDSSLVAIVCDGMGGHSAGEVASLIAVQTLKTRLGTGALDTPNDSLHAAMLEANEAIIAEAKAAGRKGMGTTAITAIVQGHTVYVGQIGDSRLYHCRQGEVLTRTRDHTRVEARLQRGEITESEARDHPESGILTRALGHRKMANREQLVPELREQAILLSPGDALVLSTDGLHDLVEDWEIAHLVEGHTAGQAAERMVKLALARGGHDNVTVMVVIAGEVGEMGERALHGAEATGPTLSMDIPGGSSGAYVPSSKAAETPVPDEDGDVLDAPPPPRTVPPQAGGDEPSVAPPSDLPRLPRPEPGTVGDGPTDAGLATFLGLAAGILLLCLSGLLLAVAPGM